MMPALLDRFVPQPDMRERHEITIRAPARIVFDVARNFDMHSIPMVQAIFWIRGKVLGARAPAGNRPTGLVDETLSMGWGRLAEEPGRFFVAGAVCQPWQADVAFSPIPPEQFASFAGPDRVKIAWTLEAEALEPALTRFASETRAVATDDKARVKFRRYWRLARIGIVMIRRLLLPALRRQAERRWRTARFSPGEGRQT
jgi:hypothetical protein